MKLNTKKQLTALYLVVSLVVLYGIPDSKSQLLQWLYPILALANLANAVRLIEKLEKHRFNYGNDSITNRVSQRTN